MDPSYWETPLLLFVLGIMRNLVSYTYFSEELRNVKHFLALRDYNFQSTQQVGNFISLALLPGGRRAKMNTIDSQTGILQRSAMCVQRFDDSRKAIHITYRISLRSSSLREPRDPLSKVVSIFIVYQVDLLVFNTSGQTTKGNDPKTLLCTGVKSSPQGFLSVSTCGSVNQ